MTRPPRLRLVTHNVTRGDGQGRVNLEIALAAANAGWEVHLYADRIDGDLPAAIRRHWIHPWPSRPVLLKIAAFSRKATRQLQGETQAGVLHACGYTLDRVHTLNAVHYLHRAEPPPRGNDARSTYRRLYRRLNAIWERRALNQAACVVAVSSLVRSQLVSLGIPDDRVLVIHNGVDLEEFRPRSVDRREFGLPVDAPLALFVGDLRTPRKNLDTVLRALTGVPGLRLAIAGAVNGSPYPALATSLGIAARCHFLGHRRDLAHLMGAADFLVAPSRYEPFSLVCLEAAACGIPVITTETVGAAELLSAGAGIVLQDPEDTPSLRRAMQSLVDNPAQRRALGAAARHAAEARPWSATANEYLTTYERLAEAGG